jgi:hypothetical protein
VTFHVRIEPGAAGVANPSEAPVASVPDDAVPERGAVDPYAVITGIITEP